MAEVILPKIPVEYAVLKDFARRGLQNAVSRAYWWPIMPNITTTNMIESYLDLADSTARLAFTLSEPLLDQVLPEGLGLSDIKGKDRAAFVNAANGLMDVLIRTDLISPDEVVAFETILRLILFQMRRLNVSYMLAADVLANRDK